MLKRDARPLNRPSENGRPKMGFKEGDPASTNDSGEVIPHEVPSTQLCVEHDLRKSVPFGSFRHWIQESKIGGGSWLSCPASMPIGRRRNGMS